MVLTLLKKEYERNKLQKKIGEEVMLNFNFFDFTFNSLDVCMSDEFFWCLGYNKKQTMTGCFRWKRK